MQRADSSDEKSAFIAGVAAFTTWGLAPVYWKLLRSISATEILAHRFVWTWIFMVALLTWQHRWPEVLRNMRHRRTAFFCVASGAAIACNWFLFIWAVNAGHVLETSLGYFMTPLFSVLLGAVFLGERLSRMQFASVLLAASGVTYLTIDLGRPPWVALALCVSFGSYGLFRKVSGAGPIAGLFLETTVIMPLALGVVAFLSATRAGHFGSAGMRFSLLLLSTGIVTGLPLLWFAQAARGLRLTTVGFLQYLAPSCTFCLGVFAYHESFRRGQLVTFALIWTALAIYSVDAIVRWRTVRALAVLAA